MAKFVASTKDNKAKIPLDQLGAAGLHGSLQVVPVLIGENDEAVARKKARNDLRDFDVKAVLSRTSNLATLQGIVDPSKGGSYMLVQPTNLYIELEGSGGKMRIDKNADNELSMVSGIVSAHSADEARMIFANGFALFADRVSFLGRIPIHVESIVVKDLQTEVQNIYFVSPPRPTQINDGGQVLPTEMAPIFALYREAQNASSPYYKVLCLYKILEGVLGPLRTYLYKRAKSEKIDISASKLTVPDHEDFPDGLRSYVGKPLKEFFDNFLQKNFRDAMAHFNLTNRAPLNLSDQSDWLKFIDVAFVTDLCARAAIEQHEAALRKLENTR